MRALILPPESGGIGAVYRSVGWPEVDGCDAHHIAELNLLPLATRQTMAERAVVHAPYLVRRASGAMRRSGRVTPWPLPVFALFHATGPA